MLQIILAIVGISLAAILSFAMNERIVAQQLDHDWAENNRRIDLAARAVSNSLRSIPGADALSPPSYVTGTFATLSTNFGAQNKTVAGVPFLYCPIGATSNGALSNLAAVQGSVPMGAHGAYSAYVFNDTVLASNLMLDSSWAGGPRPLAFIVAAGRKLSAPPSCASVKYADGKAVVDGGLVRAVYSPVDAAAPNAVSTAGTGEMSTFWVSAGASGTGRSSSSPGTIDAALSHFVQFEPERFEIILAGSVTPNINVWNAFSALAAQSGSKLIIRGADANATLSMTDSYADFEVPRTAILENLRVVGPPVRASEGVTLTLLGNIRINTPSSYALWTTRGGRLYMRNATLIGELNDTSRGVIRLNSELFMVNSTAAASASQTQNVIYATGESFVMMENSQLGTASNRPTISAIQMNAEGAFYADAGSRAYSAPGRYCWYSQSQFGTLAPKILIDRGEGVSSLINYAQADQPPAAGAPQSEIDSYEIWKERLWLARERNVSEAQCIT